MHNRVFFTLVLLFSFVPYGAFAAGLSLSVTPTLFEMSAVPSQAWTSSIKVVNNNPQDLTVYASVVNFAPQGEHGQGKFLPLFEEYNEGKTLAEWITISDEAFVIPSESGQSIPLSINIPDDASPGGHYAAIMIGTKPLQSDGSLHVQTAQVVTSLFFVRVAGEVIEKGAVRTFQAGSSFVDVPEINFEVRFENKGNVHLQPQGEIVITNMWGKERGIIPINKQTHFGNVMPNSIRKFNFAWKGEKSITDIGRYKASLALAYGADARQFATQETTFWIVPIKPVLLVLGSLFAILFLISWSIRSYVRRMLIMSGVQGYVPNSQRTTQEGDVIMQPNFSMTAPLQNGLDDLKTRFTATNKIGEILQMFFIFIVEYKKFFVGLLLILLSIIVVWSFLVEVTTTSRDYEITIDNPDAPVTISSEEIIYKKTSDAENIVISDTDELPLPVPQEYALTLINSSENVGMAAALKRHLEKFGYQITALKSDFNETKQRSVVVYDPSLQEEALVLSKILNGALLSARPRSEKNDSQSNISIFIGNDYFESLEE